MIFLVIGDAAAQAVGLAIKKHTLRVGGVNDIVAFVVFVVAGVALAAVYLILNGTLLHESIFNGRVLCDIAIASFFTVLGVLFSYRALDMADLSYLSPYSVLGIFSTALIAFIVLGEVPTHMQVLGMLCIMSGSLIMEYRAHGNASQHVRRTVARNRKALVFFALSVLFYSVPPTWQKEAVLYADPLFVAYVTHGAIAALFVVIVFVRGGFGRLRGVARVMPPMRFVLWTTAAGLLAALANGSAYFAFVDGPVALIMALKRLAPVFAFFIGLYVFRETHHVRRKVLAMIVMIGGAVIVALG